MLHSVDCTIYYLLDLDMMFLYVERPISEARRAGFEREKRIITHSLIHIHTPSSHNFRSLIVEFSKTSTRVNTARTVLSARNPIPAGLDPCGRLSMSAISLQDSDPTSCIY